MSNPWFRMYAEFATDPKVQMLSEVMQRRLMMVFCLRCSNNLVTLHDDEIAFQLRITSDELAETKALFISKKFIDKSWNVLNWEKRQMKSDNSSDRVAKHRALQKTKQQEQSNDDVTLQKQEANGLDKNRVDKNILNKATPVAAPDGVSVQTWQDFQKLRKAKRAPLTDTALDGIRREADKAGLTMEQALATCCKRGWQGFDADWVSGSKAPQSTGLPGGLI